MANNLLKLGHLFGDKNYLKISRQMVHNMVPLIKSHPSSYSNWINVYSNLSSSFYEVAIVGEDAIQKIKDINKEYVPNKIICAKTSPIKNKKLGEHNVELPLLENRFLENNTMIYVCVNNSCNFPTTSSSVALEQLNK